jgi:chloramphenicol O-acetyltransferase type A
MLPESFRYKFRRSNIFCKQINASATISRSDGSFGFSLIEFNPDFEIFTANALAEIERIQTTTGLFTELLRMTM